LKRRENGGVLNNHLFSIAEKGGNVNKHLLSDKLEGIIKELVELHLESSKADGVLLNLDNGGCVVFGTLESVAELIKTD
jgi:hypothetical protein